MRVPGAAEGLERFENDEALVRALLLEVIGRADAGDAGADDQHVEMFGLLRSGTGRSVKRCCVWHFPSLSLAGAS